MLYLEVMMQLLWWEKTGWRLLGFGARDVRQNEKSTLTAYWNFSLYSLSLARNLLSSSVQRHSEGPWVTMGWHHNRDVAECTWDAPSLIWKKKKKIGQKCTFRSERITQRLSLSVRAWERQRVHRVWALIDKSMISISPSEFESTVPWPNRHTHPNDWLELIPSTD